MRLIPLCKGTYSPRVRAFAFGAHGIPESEVHCRPQMGPMLAPWTLLSGVLPAMVQCAMWSPKGHIDAQGDSVVGYIRIMDAHYHMMGNLGLLVLYPNQPIGMK